MAGLCSSPPPPETHKRRNTSGKKKKKGTKGTILVAKQAFQTFHPTLLMF